MGCVVDLIVSLFVFGLGFVFVFVLFCFLTKWQTGECNVRNCRWFLSGMSSDIFKVRAFISDLDFKLE